MKVITVAQQKGGSGKSTTCAILASAAVAQNLAVTILDCDTDGQIMGWRNRMEAPVGKTQGAVVPTWPATLTITRAPTSVGALYEALDTLEEEGCALCLIDTKPGSSVSTEEFMFAADLVIIPTKPKTAELTLSVNTVAWLEKCKDSVSRESAFPAVRTLLLDCPLEILRELVQMEGRKKLSALDQVAVDTLRRLPHLSVPIQTSKDLANILAYGPLPAAIAAHRAMAGQQLRVSAFEGLLAVAELLLEEVMAISAVMGRA